MKSSCFSNAFTVLLLHWCVLWTLSRSQNCSSSQGTCLSSQKQCRLAREAENKACQNDDTSTPEPDLPYGVKKCKSSSRLFYLPLPCEFPHSELSSSDYNAALNVSLHSINRLNFAIKASWDVPVNSTVGYQLLVKMNDSVESCFCVNASYNLSTLYINPTTPFKQKYESRRPAMLRVELNVVVSDISLQIMETFRRKWPETCLDVNFYSDSTCALPRYPSPTEVTVYKDDSSHHLILDVEWKYNIEWNYNVTYVPPTIFYIDVYPDLLSLNFFTFVASNTTSVKIAGLNSSEEYYVSIRPYVQCSGLAYNFIVHIGCGLQETTNATCRPPPTTYPTPGANTTQPTPILTTPTETDPKQPSPQFPIKIGVAAAGGLCAIAISVASIIIFILVVRRCRKKCIPSPIPIRPTDSVVFVVYVPEDSSEKDIQTYVVSRLQEYFEVVTPDRLRGDIVELIEEQERKATAVLLVFTREFHSEWEDTKSLVVNAIRRLLSTAVSQQLLDKYAIVVLDNNSRERYIPDNHFLRSMNVYILGREKNQVEDLYRFVTKTLRFEHALLRHSHPSGSPPSSIESCDDKSMCTESLDMSSLESQQCCCDHHQLGAQRNSQHDNHQSEPVNRLLTLLSSSN